MYTLGISCYYHDSAAAILKDGIVIAAVEEERFSRKKFDDGFPELAINWCLKEAKILPEEIFEEKIGIFKTLKIGHFGGQNMATSARTKYGCTHKI